MVNVAVFRVARIAVFSVLSVMVLGAQAAKDSEHPGTTPGERAYKGAPVPEHLAEGRNPGQSVQLRFPGRVLLRGREHNPAQL